MPGTIKRKQIEKIFKTFLGNYHGFSVQPSYKNLGNVMRVTVATTSLKTGKRYSGLFKLHLTKYAVTFTLSLPKTEAKEVKGWIVSSLYFRKRVLRNLIRALEDPLAHGITLGSPSELIRKGDKFYIYLALVKKVDPKPRNSRLMGVDLGISKQLATWVVFDTEKWRMIEVGEVRSGRIRDYWRRMLRYYRKTQRNKARSNVKRRRDRRRRRKRKRPELNYAKLNKLGESLFRLATRNAVYMTVNKIIDAALRNDVSRIIVENLSGMRRKPTRLKGRLKRMAKVRNKLLREGKYDEARRMDREIRRFAALINAIARFPYGMLINDLIEEATWHGIKVLKVDPRKTSVMCPRCGGDDRRNRPNRNLFRCVNCGFTNQSDVVAALNLVSIYLGLFNRPFVGGKRPGGMGVEAKTPAHPTAHDDEGTYMPSRRMGNQATVVEMGETHDTSTDTEIGTSIRGERNEVR